ncbi:MAG: sodium:calcium antiporter [Candidatus Thorarchaeota archaeon]
MSERMTNDIDVHNHKGLRSVRSSLGAGKKEFVLIAALIVFYFYTRISGFDSGIVILLGIIVGTWLAFRPSEWAVEGVESTAGHLGMTAYVAGMLTSLASNMPEAVVSGITAVSGLVEGNLELQRLAFLSVTVAAGFNMLLLGLTIVIATRGKDEDMKVPEEAIRKDSVLIRWTIVALMSMVALGLVSATLGGETGSLIFPPHASFILFLSYIIYAVSLMRGEVATDSETAHPHHPKRSAMILTLIGFVGIFFAGEILTSSVELLLHDFRDTISLVGDPVTIPALILGAAGALPEHGIALIAAKRGKTGLAIGNLIGGVLQIVLLVMGGIGIIVPIHLDQYVLFQLVVIAGSLWFLKRAITDDHKLDLFEGMMIILLQAYVFVLFVFGTIMGYG